MPVTMQLQYRNTPFKVVQLVQVSFYYNRIKQFQLFGNTNLLKCQEPKYNTTNIFKTTTCHQKLKIGMENKF